MENATKETDTVEHKQRHINKQQDTSRMCSHIQKLEQGSRLMSTSLPPPPPHCPQSIRQACLFPPATGAQALPHCPQNICQVCLSPYHHHSSPPTSTHRQPGIKTPAEFVFPPTTAAQALPSVHVINLVYMSCNQVFITGKPKVNSYVTAFQHIAAFAMPAGRPKIVEHKMGVKSVSNIPNICMISCAQYKYEPRVMGLDSLLCEGPFIWPRSIEAIPHDLCQWHCK